MHRLSGKEKMIRIWNPLAADRDGWTSKQLLPALAYLSSEVSIMIRSDEKDAFLEALKEVEPDALFVRQPVEESEANADAFPFDLLSSWEKECMHCLIFGSSINLPKEWEIDDGNNDVIISKELAERVYQIYEPKLSSTSKANTTFEKFLNRCISDYAFLDVSEDQRAKKFILKEKSLREKLDQTLMEAISDTVKNNLATLSLNTTDPLALVILIGMAGSEHTLDTRKIDLVREFIRNVKRIENFSLISQYWKYISNNKDKDKGTLQMGLLQFMDVRTLNDLAACFVNSGMYDEAFEVYSILENIYPAKIAIEIADLKDSLGEYREALQILLKTDQEWVKSGVVEDRSLILELYLNISWVIVSGRFEERKKEGYEYLDKTENILRKLPNTENYLLFLTRFYNTKANYHEWEQHYDMAIENYQKALKLPGTILRKSSLLSNWGIAERLLGKNTKDVDTRRKHFQASRSNITQAVNMKKSIGEKNQIPGSSHNLSETLVELAGITEDKNEKRDILKEADQVTTYALEVLNELKSSKRRGRLLTEKYIAHHMLREMGEESSVDEIGVSLAGWFETEDKGSYDYRETTALLKRFGIAF
jgi:tetratricopeptide (TPR) repeat protein